jgi:GMP synthase-like glutamine amidotransferase
VDTQTIVILDFGSQYTQLIARRIREQNVFSVVLPCTAPLAEIQALKPIGIILSGGPRPSMTPMPRRRPAIARARRAHVLGICYGLHFIVHHLGGKVLSAPLREYGHAEVHIEDARTPLFSGLPATIAGLDEPWRRSRESCPRLPSHRCHLQRPRRHRQPRAAASGPCSSIPKSTTPRSARN